MLVWLAVLFLAGPVELTEAKAGAKQTSKRSHPSLRTSNPPRIDGDLSDQAWQSAPPSTGFTQTTPYPGQPASFQTIIRVLHDDQALYIAAQCLDPEPAHILARITRRDRWIESDWFQVDIDSRHDRRTGFLFMVNAAGVQADGTLYEENLISYEWDGVWDSGVRINADGWSVEMRIPFRLLRFSSAGERVVGINFIRSLSRRLESAGWQYIPPESGLRVSRYGELTGLDIQNPPLQIEATPYLALRPSLQSQGANASGVRLFDAGADARIGLGSHFNLTLSANPDFGQVEVDEVVLNLSTMETYYPEKRPFFLEDHNNFAPPGANPEHPEAQLFYTRRIGRSPRTPDLQSGDELIQAPKVPRIYGAAKLVGRTKGRLSLGVLQAVTSREEGRVQTAELDELGRLSEPLTSFSIVRLQQGFWDHSLVGAMATAVTTPDHGQALTGGTDLEMELAGGKYKLTALSMLSYLSDDRFLWQDSFTETALRQDGNLGYGGKIKLDKTSGEHLVGGVSALFYSANLAINDLGYLDRADRMFLFGRLTHRRLKPWGPLRSYHIQLSGWVDRSSAWTDLGDGINLEGWVSLARGGSMGLWSFLAWPLCDDRETRTAGKVLLCGQDLRLRTGAWYHTDERGMLGYGFRTSFETTEHGRSLQAGGCLHFNPHSQVQLKLTANYRRSTGSLRWVDTETDITGDRYLFADQHFETWDLILRGTIMFSTNLSLQTFAQLFLAGIDHRTKFDQFLIDPAPIRVAELTPNPGIADLYDSAFGTLNLSVVLRWEYLPGSLAYLVYTGAYGRYDPQAEFRFGTALDRLVDTSGQHLLMLKLSYLFF